MKIQKKTKVKYKKEKINNNIRTNSIIQTKDNMGISLTNKTKKENIIKAIKSPTINKDINNILINNNKSLKRRVKVKRKSHISLSDFDVIISLVELNN